MRNRLITRLEAGLQPNIGLTFLRRVLAVFTRSAIPPPKLNRFGQKSGALRAHCRGLTPADFGRDPRSSDSWRAGRNFISFLSGKQRTISPISRRPNFTKFENNTSIREAMKIFGTEF